MSGKYRYLAVFLIFVGLSFIVWGGFSLANELQALHLGTESQKWPVTSALIRSSTVDSRSHESKSGRNITYKCDLTYDYKVDGKSFSGSRISFATAADHYTKDDYAARRFATRFSIGTMTEVHYDQQKPEESVLIPGVDPDNFVLASVVIFFCSALSFYLAFIVATSAPRPAAMISPLERLANLILLIIVGLMGYGALNYQPAIVRILVSPDAIIHL